jgi:hypothetical protein
MERSAFALLGKEEVMVTIRVKDGTRSGADSLCRTCTRGHVIKGFGETEEEVFCRFFYIEREIRFPVSECTFYEDKRIASLTVIEEIAWFLTGRRDEASALSVHSSSARRRKPKRPVRSANRPNGKNDGEPHPFSRRG